MRCLQSGGRLRDDIENAVNGKSVLTFENCRKRLTRNKLHDEVGAAVFLAVVIHVGDSLVVDQCCVAGLGAKTLEESGVAEVLILQNLDRYLTPNDGVGGLPNFAHTADGDAGFEDVTSTEVHAG